MQLFVENLGTIICTAILFYCTMYGLHYYPISTLTIIFVGWVCGWFNRASKNIVAEDRETMRQAISLVKSAQSKLSGTDMQPVDLPAATAELENVRDLLSARASVLGYTVPTKLSTTASADRGRIKRTVLDSENVQQALRETGHPISVAEKAFDDMAANQSIRLLQMLVALFKRSMALVFPLGIRIPEDKVAQVRRTALEKGVPLVLLPTHKSHMDYMTLHYLCYTCSLPIPHVVAGENLNMPILGSILR